MGEITGKTEEYPEKNNLLELLDSGKVLNPSELVLYANIMKADTTDIKEPASELFVLSDKLTKLYETLYGENLEDIVLWSEINNVKLLGVAEEFIKKREEELYWFCSIYGTAVLNKALPDHSVSLEKTREIVSEKFNSLPESKYERRNS